MSGGLQSAIAEGWLICEVGQASKIFFSEEKKQKTLISLEHAESWNGHQ
jgi:hypothetical protein